MKFIPDHTNIDFLGRTRRNIAFVVSTLFVIASIAAILTRGLDFGIDFTGGVLLEVGYPGTADLEEIRTSLAAAGFDDAQVQRFGADTDVLVRLPPQGDIAPAALREQLQATLAVDNQDVELRRVELVSPQIGRELTEDGALAMLFATIMIFVYVMFRFQWKFAAGAVVALVHDVVIVIGFFALFRLPFDLTIVAAILAVVGYSLNDTVVVFDRIRENFFKLRGSTATDAMNVSINETLSRTIMTGVTTLLVLVALLWFGGQSIAPFSIALIAGILIGTFSSIYIASAVALVINVSPQDLVEPVKDPELVDDLP
ncbi:MAG TPA: protein translocase subunit SecF [Woeseiaceae bacterium]|nr:protein translocase subunit SecF [Woeseiaceae bacterium]